MDKSVARLTRKTNKSKKEKRLLTNIRNEIRDISIVPAEL